MFLTVSPDMRQFKQCISAPQYMQKFPSMESDGEGAASHCAPQSALPTGVLLSTQPVLARQL